MSDPVIDMRVRLADAHDELRALQATYAYAFAFGHGCTIGDHPDFQRTRRRVFELRALIKELTP